MQGGVIPSVIYKPGTSCSYPKQTRRQIMDFGLAHAQVRADPHLMPPLMRYSMASHSLKAMVERSDDMAGQKRVVERRSSGRKSSDSLSVIIVLYEYVQRVGKRPFAIGIAPMPTRDAARGTLSLSPGLSVQLCKEGRCAGEYCARVLQHRQGGLGFKGNGRNRKNNVCLKLIQNNRQDRCRPCNIRSEGFCLSMQSGVWLM